MKIKYAGSKHNKREKVLQRLFAACAENYGYDGKQNSYENILTDKNFRTRCRA